MYNSNIDQPKVLDPIDSNEAWKGIINIYEIVSLHMHLLAATNSGKTEFIKLIFIILYRVTVKISIVLFDPHGDLATYCGKFTEDVKDIIYIDPTLHKGLTPTINPFRLNNKDEENISIMAQELLIALESIIGVEFSPNMEVLLTPLIYTLLRKGDSGIDELLRFLDDENNEDLIKLALKSPIKAHRIFMKTQFSNGKFTKTKDALSTKLQIFLNNPIFSDFITGESTFDLEEALNNNKIIVFRLPKGKMRKTLEPAAKLVMALIQGIVFRRADSPKELRPKTYLICDEYQNFFSQISDEMLSESRKNNLTILGAHQYLSQLDGRSRDGLMSGANIKVVGRNANKELKIMAEEIGVNLNLLQELKTGEFYIKVGSNDAIKIITTDKFLGNRELISDWQWRCHLDYQKEHYYKKIIDETIIENSEDDSMDNSTSSLPIPPFDIEE